MQRTDSPAQPLRIRQGIRHQLSMPVEAKPRTSNPKLEHKAPPAARRRKQRVEVETAARTRGLKSPRPPDGARQLSPQRRSARFDRAARSARPALDHPPEVCAGRTGRQQRVVESVRVGWGGEIRSAATRYRARTIWRVASVRAARCSSRHRWRKALPPRETMDILATRARA